MTTQIVILSAGNDIKEVAFAVGNQSKIVLTTQTFARQREPNSHRC